MIYEPFFDMNILISADAVQKVSYVAGGLILFHVVYLLASFYLVYLHIPKKSTYDSEDI